MEQSSLKVKFDFQIFKLILGSLIIVNSSIDLSNNSLLFVNESAIFTNTQLIFSESTNISVKGCINLTNTNISVHLSKLDLKKENEEKILMNSSDGCLNGDGNISFSFSDTPP